jgi:hypothetical protein
MSKSRYVIAAWGLFAACAVLRVGLVDRQGLWADEFFSLAMATGHSLEHPAAAAEPALGDFAEVPEPLPPSAYSRFLEHDNPPASPGRVLRAVYLSDTSPPLYYLLLYGWTRVLGTSDAALRLFSVGWALACFPVMWSLARNVGGRVAAVPTCVLFTFSPLCVFYSSEGRMYSLLWFWTACTMWLTLRLRWKGFALGLFLSWVAACAAGFLTHYFYAFVWCAVVAWLLFRPRRLSRPAVVAAAVLVILAILPWYDRLPASMTSSRVTDYWLNIRPEGFSRLSGCLELLWSFFSVQGVWGAGARIGYVNLAIYLTLAGAAFWKLRWSLVRGRRLLLWLCVASACLGVVAFDWWRATYASAVPRYALAGMPAAFLLVGVSVGHLTRVLRVVFVILLVLACLVGIRRMYLNPNRSYEAARPIGQLLADQANSADVVIVHSIPSGVAGIARYMESHGASAKGIGFASWVGQLKQRQVPRDLQRLAAGRLRIILVKIHEVMEPAPEETWLEQHATKTQVIDRDGVTVSFFVPRDSERFFLPSS